MASNGKKRTSKVKKKFLFYFSILKLKTFYLLEFIIVGSFSIRQCLLLVPPFSIHTTTNICSIIIPSFRFSIQTLQFGRYIVVGRSVGFGRVYLKFGIERGWIRLNRRVWDERRKKDDHCAKRKFIRLETLLFFIIPTVYYKLR